VVEPFQEFDLSEEIKELKRGGGLQAARNAKTLVKKADLRIVLTALKANARVHEHQVNATVAIHTVAGHTRIHAGDREVDLPAGHLLVLEKDLAHDVEAVTDSVFLLTIAWPNGGNA
jgi:quercetin dioxygenase-like cupin family protein